MTLFERCIYEAEQAVQQRLAELPSAWQDFDWSDWFLEYDPVGRTTEVHAFKRIAEQTEARRNRHYYRSVRRNPETGQVNLRQLHEMYGRMTVHINSIDGSRKWEF